MCFKHVMILDPTNTVSVGMTTGRLYINIHMQPRSHGTQPLELDFTLQGSGQEASKFDHFIGIQPLLPISVAFLDFLRFIFHGTWACCSSASCMPLECHCFCRTGHGCHLSSSDSQMVKYSKINNLTDIKPTLKMVVSDLW